MQQFIFPFNTYVWVCVSLAGSLCFCCQSVIHIKLSPWIKCILILERTICDSSSSHYYRAEEPFSIRIKKYHLYFLKFCWTDNIFSVNLNTLTGLNIIYWINTYKHKNISNIEYKVLILFHRMKTTSTSQ